MCRKKIGDKELDIKEAEKVFRKSIREEIAYGPNLVYEINYERLFAPAVAGTTQAKHNLLTFRSPTSTGQVGLYRANIVQGLRVQGKDENTSATSRNVQIDL